MKMARNLEVFKVKVQQCYGLPELMRLRHSMAKLTCNYNLSLQGRVVQSWVKIIQG